MATFAVAHNGATGVTLERMKGMTSMRDVMRDIAPMIQGSAPYDALAVSEAGYLIASQAGMTMLELFPKESASGVTFAKSAIWSDWQEFAALAEELQTYGEALSVSATVGLAVSPMPEQPSAELADEPESRPENTRAREIATLMGYPAPDSAAVPPRPLATMTTIEPMESAELGAGDIFAKISGTCSACHARFRDGKG